MINSDSSIPTRTISGDELVEMIYQGESFPQNSRFLPVASGGVFRYFHIEDLVRYRGTENRYYPLVEIEKEVVGLAGLEKDPYRDLNIWIQFISVDPVFQGRGYASLLAEEIFRFAQENNCSLQSSSYSKEGYTKLKPKLNELANKYAVSFLDSERLLGW